MSLANCCHPNCQRPQGKVIKVIGSTTPTRAYAYYTWACRAHQQWAARKVR